MEKEYRNIGYPFLFLLALIIFGFFKTYFGQFPHFNEHTTIIVHFHAFVILLWIFLLIVQPFLIRYNKLALHRILGRCTYVLAPLIVCSFIGMMLKQIGEEQLQKIPIASLIRSLYLPFTDTLLFSTFYMLGIKNICNTAFHMRYIAVTGLVFVDASLIRSLGIWFHVDFFYGALASISFVDLIFITLIFNDKLHGRSTRPLLICLTLFAVAQTGIIILFHH